MIMRSNGWMSTCILIQNTVREVGAQLILVPFDHYQQIQRTHVFEVVSGEMVHPFADGQVMAGNSTIGAEIVEALPDVYAILVPYDGGGLSCGIAKALRQIKPSVHIFACKTAAASPLAQSLAVQHPVEVSFTPSFISGIGAPFVFPEMWPIASQLLDGYLVVSLQQTAEAIRLLALRHRVITEGAGAVAVAAPIAGKVKSKRIICIVSGGNIDMDKLAIILSGEMP
jgi:threonine dehydratase